MILSGHSLFFLQQSRTGQDISACLPVRISRLSAWSHVEAVLAEMINRGAEVILICTCLIKPIPYLPKCAYVDEIADAIRALDVQIVMGTH
jgi:hypothetical protein